jgi:integrase
MRVARMPFLQLVSGKYRVRIVVADDLRPHLPPPHTGKESLTKALGTGDEREANRLAVPWIAEFQAAINTASRMRQNPTLADWVQRYAHHYPGQSPFPPEGWFSPPHPAILAAPAEAASKPVTFESIIKFWGKNKGKQAVGNTKTKCGKFADWLREDAGHDDMARVTFANGRDWRDDMIEEGELAPGSISNHLKLVKALFNYAFENEHIPTNHMARVKYSPDDGEERDDFTPDERRLILTLAREGEPHIYWVNWICSLHGNRTGEITDASTLDIECIEGIWAFAIHTKNRSKDQRLKTPVSTRRLALHQAVLDEGFIDFRDEVRRKHGDGPLFRDVSLDCYGRRVGHITTELSLWLRGTVGITDSRKPFYSHRHTATSYLRNTLGPDCAFR